MYEGSIDTVICMYRAFIEEKPFLVKILYFKNFSRKIFFIIFFRTINVIVYLVAINCIIVIYFKKIMKAMTLKTKPLAIAVVAIASLGILAFPLGLASAVSDYLGINASKSSINFGPTELDKSVIATFGDIPREGQGGAFGYGILTSGGNSIIVTTTHPGVLDSALQKGDINSPVWHNHYVKLGTDASCISGTNPSGLSVADISYESPGKVDVDGKKVQLKDIPTGSQNEHFGLAPNAVHAFNVGTTGNTLVSFTLSIVGSGPYGPGAVCVNNVSPVTLP